MRMAKWRLIAVSVIILAYVQYGMSTKLIKHRRHRSHWTETDDQQNGHVAMHDEPLNDQEETEQTDDQNQGGDADGGEGGDTQDEVPQVQDGEEQAQEEAQTTTEAPAPAPMTTQAPPNPECEKDRLNDCLSESLDNWAQLLYKIQDNIVAIDERDCNIARDAIKKCIENKLDELKCNEANALEVGAKITDVLLHKKDSGNWLRSYYVTAYVCENADGRKLRDEISQECLKHEKISETTLGAISYMDQHLFGEGKSKANNTYRCDELKKQLNLLRSIGNSRCSGDNGKKAGQLMCETGKLAFLKMHPSMFHDGAPCDFDCKQEPVIPPSQAPDGESSPEAPAQPGASNGGGAQPTDEGADGQKGAASYGVLQERKLISSFLMALITAVLGTLILQAH